MNDSVREGEMQEIMEQVHGGFHERRMDMEPLVAKEAGRMKGYDVSCHEDARIDAHYSAHDDPAVILERNE